MPSHWCKTRAMAFSGFYPFGAGGGVNHLIEEFYKKVDAQFRLTDKDRVLYARTLYYLENYRTALKTLEDVNHNQPSAEAYYWLARIHAKSEDWDAMEIASQKASVLDSANSSYHLLFSQALGHNNKMERAESEADLAIETAKDSSAALHNHRAWVRWRRKDYQGAAADWKTAGALNPKYAGYYFAWCGRAYEKLGDLNEAVVNLRKAIEFEPENQKYKEKYIEILKKLEMNDSIESSRVLERQPQIQEKTEMLKFYC